MGKTVVFWTDKKEYGDTSRIMAALACALGITEGKNVAVTALPGSPSAFLDLFNVRMPEKIRSGKDSSVGFYSLLQRALYEQPVEKTVMDAGIRTINKGPLLFPWFDYDESEMTEKNSVALIMKVMKDIFEYVLVDAGVGERGVYSDLLIKNADLVVVLLPQDKKSWQDYLNSMPLSTAGKLLYVMHPYLEKSAYSSGWFSYHFCRDRNNVYGLPASASFLDACMEGRVAELFLEAGSRKKRHESAFFRAVAKFCKVVIKEL